MNARWTAGAGADGALGTIDEMYARLGGSYFEILGVARDCDAEALRRAYRAVCERFHPDLFSEAELGQRRPQLEVILREATNAFQVLIRPDLRAEYERELAPSSEPYTPAYTPAPPAISAAAPRSSVSRATPTPMIPSPVPPSAAPVAQSVIAFGERPGAERSPSGPNEAAGGHPMSLRFPTPVLGVVTPPALSAPEPPSPATPVRSASTLKRTPIAALQAAPAPMALKPEISPPPSTVPLDPPRSLSPSAIPARPERGSMTPPTLTTRAPSRPSVPVATERASVRAPDPTTINSLQRGRAEMLLRQKRQQREELDAQVASALQRGEMDKALQMLRHALTLDASDETLTRRIQQLEAAARSTDIDRTVQAARSHERNKRWELAAELWSKAAAQFPNEYSYHLYAAQAYCESGNELAKAADLARRAIRLRGDAVEAHLCLARAFFRAGRTASAKSAMEQAVKLAPQNPEVVELARQLRM